MLFKLILSHVIFEPRYSMIANRTITPSCRSLTTGARSNIPFKSSLCCCSLTIKDAGLLKRYYSSPGYQDGRRTRDSLGRNSFRPVDPSEVETLRQRLNAYVKTQARKSSSIGRFEPCYRQIYPSKKRKATFKIPKKPPYIPAVYQKKTVSYRDKYEKMNLGVLKGRTLRWPPLYPSKKEYKQQEESTAGKSKELPAWLLPLYSCKACRNEDAPSTSEAHYSGTAFHRKMEMVTNLKHIQANPKSFSSVPEKKLTKQEIARYNLEKTKNAVEALKRKIGSMQDYLRALENLEAYKKRYHTQNKLQDTLPEDPLPVRQAYGPLYQTKPPTLEREVRVRKSSGIVAMPKPAEKAPPQPPPPPLLPNKTDQPVDNTKELETKLDRTPKKQHDESTTKNAEVVTISPKQPIASKNATVEANVFPVSEIHKESVVMIKQPSWKKYLSNQRNESSTNEKKVQISNNQTPNGSLSNIQSLTQRKGEFSNDLLANQQLRSGKKQDIQVGHPKTPDTWTVESLKSRINVMKIKSTTGQPEMRKVEDMGTMRNGGEIQPKISQVALRSFHKDSGTKNLRKLPVGNTMKPHVGCTMSMGRRNYSTFRPTSSVRPALTAWVSCRRTIASTPPSKKRSWVNRLKRCLVLKKVKGIKFQNWKEAPREIPYASEEVKPISPAPVLWNPLSYNDKIKEPKRSNPPQVLLKEKVHPAVLNAEQRVLASISRLVSTKQQAEAPDVQSDIEKKLKKAKHKVNLMPWFKTPKRAEKEPNLPRVTRDDLESEEPRESGYEWILRNRDMVEELKRQSRHAAGKPLVPTEVKMSIDKYKVPLKAEISRYRQKMERKSSEPYFMYSTSKRWYSTYHSARHHRLLSRTDVILVNLRGIKTTVSRTENATPGKFVGRRTRWDVLLGRTLTRHKQRKKKPQANESNENPSEETQTNKWAWKVPNKTRAFVPKATSLTSPSKMTSSRMSEMSPCALKKQVEELKRLIKKARQEVLDKTDDTRGESQTGDKYEARLKRLVLAAHKNAEKMKIKEPRYTSENNMLANKPGIEKKSTLQAMEKKSTPQAMVQYDTKQKDDGKQKPEVSVLKSLLKKTEGESNSPPDEFMYRNNFSSFPIPLSKNNHEKPMTRVYLKLKSVVEAVRRKSALLDPMGEVKLLSAKSLKGSISMDSMFPQNNMKTSYKASEEAKCDTDTEASSATVELLAQRTPAPSETITLWNPKQSELNQVSNKEEPSYGDLFSLFSRAKCLFYDPPMEVNRETDVKVQTTEVNKVANHSVNQNATSAATTENEMAKSLMSIREDVTSAARAISKQRQYPPKLDKTEPQASHPYNLQQTDSGGRNLQYLMTKSKMIPAEVLQLESKGIDHLWPSIPVKVLDEEDLCQKSSVQKTKIDESQTKHVRNTSSMPTLKQIGQKVMTASFVETRSPTESSAFQEAKETTGRETKTIPDLFQKPISAFESFTKNLGLFGKLSESPRNAESGEVQNECRHLAKQTADFSNPSTEELNASCNETRSFMETKNTPVDDNTLNSQAPTNTQEVILHQNRVPNVTYSEGQANDWYNQPKRDPVQNCIEGLKPLEDTVKKYESYYRNYFSEDLISGYEQLHEVYDGLHKLNAVPRSLEGPFEIPAEKGNQSTQVQDDTNKMPVMDSQYENMHYAQYADAHYGMSGVQSDGQMEHQTRTQQDAAVNHVAASGNQVFSDVKGSHGNGMYETVLQQGGRIIESHSTKENFQQTDEIDQIKPVDLTRYTERFIDPMGNVQEGIHTQEEEPVETEMASLENNNLKPSGQTRFDSINAEEEPAHFNELLTQDPTLNPEVVKNLKLPAILSEDRQTEKNWYTKFHTGPRQNR